MRNFLINMGKTVYYGWLSIPETPTDEQFYGMGLCLFAIGCASAAILALFGFILFIYKIRRKRNDKREIR